MCSVVGIVGIDNVNQDIFDALTVLQHRGQDAAGMVTYDNGAFCLRKANGLVRDVIRSRHMKRLLGNIGIGHTRYPTAGSSNEAEAQPFYVNSPYGIALAHNGNLTNAEELRKALFHDGLRHLNTSSDSEVLLNVFAEELQKLGKLSASADDIFSAIAKVHQRCRGAYAAISMIAGVGLVAFRDPLGIRPLIYGERKNDSGKTEYMVASESVALDVLGFTVIGDVAPGEAIFIDKDGNLHRQQCAENPQLSPCLFEFVYLSRPDSFIDKSSVYKVRLRLGESLAEAIQAQLPDHDIDVVMPVPDTGRTAAYALANCLGVKFREGLVKNRYIARTFIMPGQTQRSKSVRQKLNTIGLEFKNKNVLLVDDSIVRGTTSRQIIQLARDAGANKVYFASAAPPVCYPNVYGIDMPSPKELVAHERTTEEVCEFIGADGLFYQDLDALVEAAREGNPSIKRFDASVFTGEYLTGDIDEAYLARLDASRNDEAKQQKQEDVSMLDLHNAQ